MSELIKLLIATHTYIHNLYIHKSINLFFLSIVTNILTNKLQKSLKRFYISFLALKENAMLLYFIL